MPYKTTEQWAQSIISGELKIEELKKFCAADLQDLNRLAGYVENHNQEGIKGWVIDNISQPIWSDKDGLNGMHIAALQGNTNVLKYLIDKGGDVNSTTTDGYTPLYNAWRREAADAFNILLEAGADLNTDFEGKPLMSHMLGFIKSDWNEEREGGHKFLSKIVPKMVELGIKVPATHIPEFLFCIMGIDVFNFDPYFRHDIPAVKYTLDLVRLCGFDYSFDETRLRSDITNIAKKIENWMAKYPIASPQQYLEYTRLFSINFYLEKLQDLYKSSSKPEIFENPKSLKRFLEEQQNKLIRDAIKGWPIKSTKLSSIHIYDTEDGQPSFGELAKIIYHLKSDLFEEILNLMSSSDLCTMEAAATKVLYDVIEPGLLKPIGEESMIES